MKNIFNYNKRRQCIYNVRLDSDLKTLKEHMKMADDDEHRPLCKIVL